MTTYRLERRLVPMRDIDNFRERWAAWCRQAGPNPLEEEGLLDEQGNIIERWVDAGEISDEGLPEDWTIEAELERLSTTGPQYRVAE